VLESPSRCPRCLPLLFSSFADLLRCSRHLFRRSTRPNPLSLFPRNRADQIRSFHIRRPTPQVLIMGGETASRPSSGAYPRLATGPVGKKIHKIYTSRLGMFTDNGQYYEDGLLAYVLSGAHFVLLHPDRSTANYTRARSKESLISSSQYTPHRTSIDLHSKKQHPTLLRARIQELNSDRPGQPIGSRSRLLFPTRLRISRISNSTGTQTTRV